MEKGRRPEQLSLSLSLSHSVSVSVYPASNFKIWHWEAWPNYDASNELGLTPIRALALPWRAASLSVSQRLRHCLD
jgi:hypothetical protein